MNVVMVPYSPPILRCGRGAMTVCLDARDGLEDCVTKSQWIPGRGCRPGDLRSCSSKLKVFMAMITRDVETRERTVGYKLAVFVLNNSSLHLCTVHALIQPGAVELDLAQDLQRTLIEDRGCSTVFNNKMSSHQKLEKAAQRQERQTWSLLVPAGLEKCL